MNISEAKTLKLGNRITHHPKGLKKSLNLGYYGEITKLRCDGVSVRWADGWTESIQFDKMTTISLKP